MLAQQRYGKKGYERNARLMKGYATLNSMRVRAAIHVSEARNAEAKLDMTSGLASCLRRNEQAAIDSTGIGPVRSRCHFRANWP